MAIDEAPRAVAPAADDLAPVVRPQVEHVPAEAQAAIRVKMGDTVYFVPVAPLMAAYSEDKAPDFLTGANQSGKSALLRAALKGALSLAWPVVTDFVKTFNREWIASGRAPLPLPDLTTRRKDGLLYFTQYSLALCLTMLCSFTLEAHGEPLAGVDGYVRVAGLSAPDFDALGVGASGADSAGPSDDPDN